MADDLATSLALQSYTRALVALLRTCADLNHKDVARLCGVSRPLVSRWIAGQDPMALAHERTLRHRLTLAIRTKRATLTRLDTPTLTQLRRQLMRTLTELDGAYLAMAQQYTDINRASTTETFGDIAQTQQSAATPEVITQMDSEKQRAIAARIAIPGLWLAIYARNRALRALVDPSTEANILQNVRDLLDFAETVYGLEQGEQASEKGPKHRRRGRPKHTTV
jgi:hypothetical protein